MAIIKRVRQMDNKGEIAPPLLISRKRCSRSSSLETIFEEGSSGDHLLHYQSFQIFVPSKRVFFLLPLSVSLAFSFIMYSHI